MTISVLEREKRKKRRWRWRRRRRRRITKKQSTIIRKGEIREELVNRVEMRRGILARITDDPIPSHTIPCLLPRTMLAHSEREKDNAMSKRMMMMMMMRRRRRWWWWGRYPEVWLKDLRLSLALPEVAHIPEMKNR